MKNYLKMFVITAMVIGLLMAACDGGDGNLYNYPPASVDPANTVSPADAADSAAEGHVHSFGAWTKSEKFGLKERSCACGEKEYAAEDYTQFTLQQFLDAAFIPSLTQNYTVLLTGDNWSPDIYYIDNDKTINIFDGNNNGFQDNTIWYYQYISHDANYVYYDEYFYDDEYYYDDYCKHISNDFGFNLFMSDYVEDTISLNISDYVEINGEWVDNTTHEKTDIIITITEDSVIVKRICYTDTAKVTIDCEYTYEFTDFGMTKIIIPSEFFETGEAAPKKKAPAPAAAPIF